MTVPGANRQRTLIYTDAEGDAICAWASSQDRLRWQVGAMVLQTFRYTGLRLNELITCRLDDLDLDANRLSVGKGDKRRVVPVPPVPSPILSQYVDQVRPTLRPSPYLFVNPHGHHQGAYVGRFGPLPVEALVEEAGWTSTRSSACSPTPGS